MVMKSHTPTDEARNMVEVLVAGGTPKRTIARSMGMGMNTLRRYYKGELETGLELANAKVVRRLFRLIEQGSTPATIFWLKTRAGWKEGTVVEIEEKSTGPNYDFANMSGEERQKLRVLLEKAVGAEPITH